MSELHRLFKLALATFVMIAITLPASSQRTMAEELNVVYKPSSKDPDETAILIFSEINQKAAADFGRILAEHRRAYPKHFVHIYLDSPGGDIYAAMIIGRHIRGDPNHAVYVNKDARCFSACIFVLAGGTQRFMDGRIGIHRPYSVLPSNNYSENQKWYSRVATDAKSYFRDMNISEKLYDDMVTIEPEWRCPGRC